MTAERLPGFNHEGEPSNPEKELMEEPGRTGPITRRDFLDATLGVFVGGENLEAAQKKAARKKQKKIPQRPPPKPRPLDSLSGSKESLDRQEQEAKAEKLSWIKDEKELDDMARRGLLVPLPNTQDISFDPYLSMEGNFKDKKGRERRKYNRAYCLPQTRQFLLDLASKYREENPQGPKLLFFITSAVRPLDVQAGLRSIHPNVSLRSMHPTGAVVDIAYGRVPKRDLSGQVLQETLPNKKKRSLFVYEGLTNEQQLWVEKQLREKELPDSKGQQLIEATKEIYEPCYHVMVFKRYS